MGDNPKIYGRIYLIINSSRGEMDENGVYACVIHVSLCVPSGRRDENG